MFEAGAAPMPPLADSVLRLLFHYERLGDFLGTAPFNTGPLIASGIEAGQVLNELFRVVEEVGRGGMVKSIAQKIRCSARQSR